MIRISTSVKTFHVDTVTPVSIYLRLRDGFRYCLLLESADHRGLKDAWSYICVKPFAQFKVEDSQIRITLPDGTDSRRPITARTDVRNSLDEFIGSFILTERDSSIPSA